MCSHSAPHSRMALWALTLQTQDQTLLPLFPRCVTLGSTWVELLSTQNSYVAVLNPSI